MRRLWKKVKNACPFLEELPFFGKEERKARQVDLLIVGFDVREVGVDCQIQRQVVREAIFEIYAGLTLDVVIAGIAGPGVVQRE
jgi:hypothetical protein